MDKQTCGTCRWGQFEMTKDQRPVFRQAGKCKWPVPEIKLPLSITRAVHQTPADFGIRSYVLPAWTDCPVWLSKTLQPSFEKAVKVTNRLLRSELSGAD